MTRERPEMFVLSSAFLKPFDGFARCCLNRERLFKYPKRCSTVLNFVLLHHRYSQDLIGSHRGSPEAHAADYPAIEDGPDVRETGRSLKF